MTDTPAGTQPDRPHGESETDESPASRTRVENPLVGQRADAPLSLEEVFDVLRNERRQHVLSYLLLADDDVTIGDLAEHIAAIENDKPVQALTSQERKRVYVALYQCHLPKMASADVVEFQKDRGRVEAGPNIAQLEPYLDSPGEADPEDGVPVQYVLLSASAVIAYLLAAVLQPGGRLVGGVVLVAGLSLFAAMTYVAERDDPDSE